MSRISIGQEMDGYTPRGDECSADSLDGET